MAAGARAHDQGDLRDDAGGVHVAPEDLAVEAERDHALLDAGAAALVDADDRAAGLDREVHDLDDLLAVDLAERAAEDGEVLGEHADLAAVDGAVAGDDAVAVGRFFSRPKAVERCRASSSSSTNEPSSSSCSMRSRAVLLPLACCFSTALAEPAWTASSRRRSRSASLPAVVWMSMSSGTSVPSPGAALTCSTPRPASRTADSSANLVPMSDHGTAAHRSTAARRAGRLAGRGRRRGGLAPTPIVAERFRAGEPEGLVLVAEHQTAGRGRLDRDLGDPGARPLTFSVLLRARGVAAARWPWLPLLTGVAPPRRYAGSPGVEVGPEVAQRRARSRAQAGRHPGRAGRDAGAAGRGPRHRPQRAHRRRRAPGADRHVAGARRPGSRRTGRRCLPPRRGARPAATRVAGRARTSRRLPRAVRRLGQRGPRRPARRRALRQAVGVDEGAGSCTTEAGQERLGAGDVVHVRPSSAARGLRAVA